MLTSPARNSASRRMPHQQVAVGDHAVDPGPGQGAGELAGGLLPGRGVGDHLGEHRVVVRRHLAAGLEARRRPGSAVAIDGDLEAWSARRSAAGSRRPGPRRTAGPRSRGRRRSGFDEARAAARPLGDRELQLDQVDAVDRLGDRVLDLEAGVHLQEPEPLGGRVVEELDGAGAAVVDRLGGRCGPRRAGRPRTSSASPGAGDSSTTFWCRRWIEQSRSPSTSTPWRRRRPAPRRAGRARRTARRRPCRRRTPTRPRPRPSAISPGRSASGRTIRIPRPPPPADAFTSSGRSASVAASAGRCEDRHAGGLHQLLGLHLGPHRLDRLGRRPDPGQPGVDHGAGEVGVLGQEAVAGVDRVGAGPLRGLDEQVAAQVGLGGRVAGQAHGEVGLARRTAAPRRRRSGRRRSRSRAGGRCGRRGWRSRPGWRPGVAIVRSSAEDAEAVGAGVRTRCRSRTGRCRARCGCRAGR